MRDLEQIQKDIEAFIIGYFIEYQVESFEIDYKNLHQKIKEIAKYNHSLNDLKQFFHINYPNLNFGHYLHTCFLIKI